VSIFDTIGNAVGDVGNAIGSLFQGGHPGRVHFLDEEESPGPEELASEQPRVASDAPDPES
jgi:hypothetical protein